MEQSKKQLPFAKEKEKEVAPLRPMRDDESKEERHLESKVQSYKDIQSLQSLSKQLRGGEIGAATSNDIESIQDTRVQSEEKTTNSSSCSHNNIKP